MSVTTIIVNFNSGALLAECLAHLQRQTVHSTKIIVVDNASCDGSALVTSAYPNVVLCQMECNIGFAGANNVALSMADTEFVALLNPDAFPEPDWLEQLLVVARKEKDIAAFGSRQLCSDNDQVLDGVGDHYHITGLVWRGRHGKVQNDDDLLQRDIFSPCAAAALYRRHALTEIGGFDADYFCYVEDVDVGFRLRLAGYRSIYVPGAIVRHVGSATTGGKRSSFSVYHGHRNLVWTFIKDMPGVLFWILLPFHFLLNLLTIAFFIWRGQAGVILRAKRDALLGLGVAWSKRKEIQGKRVAKIGEIWKILDKKLFASRIDA